MDSTTDPASLSTSSSSSCCDTTEDYDDATQEEWDYDDGDDEQMNDYDLSTETRTNDIQHNCKEEGYSSISPPPPPHPRKVDEIQRRQQQHEAGLSLDFQRVINEYSIQAIIDSLPSPLDPSLLASISTAGSDETSSLLLANQEHNINQLNENDQGKKRSHISNSGGRPCTRWFLTIAVALFMGLIAISIAKFTERIIEWRSERLRIMWQTLSYDSSFDGISSNNKTLLLGLFFITFNLCLALVSAALTIWVCPQAAGSGIPEVIAYLNGVRIYKFGKWALFTVKIFATILSVSSGLVCGPEGPFIHIGAILGLGVTKLPGIMQPIFTATTTSRTQPPPSGLCTKIRDRLWGWFQFDLAHFATDAERRDLVSVGAAVGFAACFGAPVGGLLFALEEASSFFPHPLLLRTLTATALATSFMAVHNGSLSNYSVISLGSYSASSTFLSRFQEVPLYILNAALGGAIGGLFVKCWKAIQEQRKSIYCQVSSVTKKRIQLGEVAILSLMTSILTFYLSTRGWACKRSKLFRQDLTKDVWEVPRVLCGPKERNEVAGILFGGRDAPIRAILLNPEQFDTRTLFAVGCSFLFLMVLTLGVSLPSGIFMPTFLVGCSLGGLMGVKYKQLLSDEISPSTYALLGSAAILTGIQRSTVSLCVILVEGTGQIKVLIPVIVTILVARYVGDKVTSEGIYEVAIELRDYPYLHHDSDKKRHDIFQVKSIMSTPPICLGTSETALDISRLLETCTHNGFPVVDEAGKFRGLVRRDQLVALLECGVFMSDKDISDVETEGGKRGGKLKLNRSRKKWSPRPGATSSPLMNLAYHIKDDRYEHLSERRKSSSQSSRDVANDHLTWNENLLRSVKKLDMESLPNKISEHIKLGIHHAPANATRYAWVRRTSTGQIGVVLNPMYCMERVHVAAVMNRGAHTVTEFCPVSTAKMMFTSLGLRHLVVLGGATGGDVVGILSRSNLLSKHIDQMSDAKYLRRNT